MKNTELPEEAEIINPGGKGNGQSNYRTRYTTYANQVKSGSLIAFWFSLLALLLSLLPFIGVVFSLAAMVFAKLKHANIILAAFAFVVSCISTTMFLLLILLLRWIF